jgi:hypothetical protein
MTYSVSPSDIEARWRPLSDAETDIANTLIDDAITLIDVYRPSLAAAVASGVVPERIVIMTVVEAVKRVLANPDLLANQSISADGGVSIGWQFQQKDPRPQMTLSLLDFANIDQAMTGAGLGTGVVGTMQMTNSTSWSRKGAYRRGRFVDSESEASDLMPGVTVSDSVSIRKG